MAIELEDGTIIRSLPEKVSHIGEQQEETQIQLDNLQARVEAALAGVLHYKGSVATYSDLPNEAEIGDVYNVIDTGANYAWTGSEWDELGSSVDLSQLVDLTSPQTITGVKTFQNGLAVGQRTYPRGADFRDDGIYPFTGYNDFQIGSDVHPIKSIYLTDYLYFGDDWKVEEYSNYQLAIYRQNDLKYIFASLEFIPNYNDQNSLGNTNQRWKNLYLSGKSIYSYSSGTDFSIGKSSAYSLSIYYGNDIRYNFQAYSFFPQLSNQQDLGGDTNFWRHLFIKGQIKTSNNTYGLTLPDTSGFTANSEIVDTASAQTISAVKTFTVDIKLGTTNSPFIGKTEDNRLYLGADGGVQIKAPYGLIFEMSSGAVRTNNPNNNIDLGSASYKWKNLYLSGNLSDGPNNVTIADLKALIDYAKAQGWIS